MFYTILFFYRGDIIKKEALKGIGENIQKARLKRKLTQEQLAEKCNVSSEYISSLERGLSSGSISLIVDICNALDITPDYVFSKCINSNCDSNYNIDILDTETSVAYLKLKDDNKNFVNYTIKHLYSMQRKR